MKVDFPHDLATELVMALMDKWAVENRQAHVL